MLECSVTLCANLRQLIGTHKHGVTLTQDHHNHVISYAQLITSAVLVISPWNLKTWNTNSLHGFVWSPHAPQAQFKAMVPLVPECQ